MSEAGTRLLGVERIGVAWAGLTVLVACLIGGGTVANLASDRIIQAMMIPLAIIALLRADHMRAGWPVLTWLGLLLAVVLANLAFFLTPNPLTDTQLGSINPDRAVSYALFVSSLIGFAAYVLTLGDRAVKRIMLVFLTGLLVNVCVAALQLSSDRLTQTQGPFYVLSAGLFANQNHFSALIHAFIPLLGWMLLDQARQPALFVLSTAAMALVLFAAQSYAAMALLIMTVLASAAIFFRNSYGRRSVILSVLVGVVFVVGFIFIFMVQEPGDFSRDLRLQFWANTWAAVADWMPFGTGFGGFHVVYPAYESIDQELSVFANYAHNDWLEWVLETGVPGIAIAVFAILLALTNAFQSALKMGCALTLFALSLHSVVDYPVRTMPVAMLATFCLMVLWSRPHRVRRHGNAEAKQSNARERAEALAALHEPELIATRTANSR
ncbi:MAG: O-antigen ligase family protein [Pseudomonadota bacterium]